MIEKNIPHSIPCFHLNLHWHCKSSMVNSLDPACKTKPILVFFCSPLHQFSLENLCWQAIIFWCVLLCLIRFLEHDRHNDVQLQTWNQNQPHQRKTSPICSRACWIPDDFLVRLCAGSVCIMLNSWLNSGCVVHSSAGEEGARDARASHQARGGEVRLGGQDQAPGLRGEDPRSFRIAIPWPQKCNSPFILIGEIEFEIGRRRNGVNFCQLLRDEAAWNSEPLTHHVIPSRDTPTWHVSFQFACSAAPCSGSFTAFFSRDLHELLWFWAYHLKVTEKMQQ